MAEEIKKVEMEKTRRAVVKTAAQVAVTAPAVGLLLSASSKSALAQSPYNRGVLPGDDAVQTDHGGGNFNDSSNPNVIFTSGNDDTITLGDDAGSTGGTH